MFSTNALVIAIVTILSLSNSTPPSGRGDHSRQ